MMAEAQSKAIVDVGGLGPEAEAVAMEACAMAGVEAVRWTRETRPVAPGASVLVTGLRTGERRIPDEVMGLCAEAAPRAPLVLLCEDDLVRPALRLHEGRVTLVSRPLSATRVYSQIRTALVASAKRAAGLSWKSERAAGGEVLVRESASATWWLGTLSAGTAEHQPSVEVRSESEGLTVVLPAASASVTKREVTGAHHVAAGSTPLERKRAALASLLGERATVVHYSVASRSWSAYAPSEAARPILCSTHRLPNVSPLGSRVPAPTLTSLGAVEGDLLVAATAEAGDWLAEVEAEELVDGGPAALRALQKVAEQSPATGALLLLEVRW